MQLSRLAFLPQVRSLSAKTKVETFPRPLGVYGKHIQPDDIVHDFGDYKLFRARPSHVPLLIDTMKDFIRSEPTHVAVGLTEPKDEYVVPMLHNVTRYPFSFFAVNNNYEIVATIVQDVIYRNNEEDPFPSFGLSISDPKDPFNAIANVVGYGEKRLFEILETDRFLRGKATYVPTSLHRKGISSSLYPVVYRLILKEAVKMGLRYKVGIITSHANLGNIKKLHFKAIEKIPKEVYKGAFLPASFPAMQLSRLAFLPQVRSLSAKTKVETFPRPLGVYGKHIQPDDIVHDFGDYKMFRARPAHVPLLMDSLKDLIRCEPSNVAAGLKEPNDEYVVPLLHNLTRYPFSCFAVNNDSEIIAFAVHDVIYRNNEEEPLPRFAFPISDPKDPFNVIANIIDYGENRLFELLGVDKFIYNGAVYVPTSMQRKGISSSILPYVLKHIFTEAVKMGFQYNVGIITSNANLGNIGKLKGSKFHGMIPKEVYKGLDGKPLQLLEGEDTASLVSIDMVESVEKKIYV